MWVVEGVRGLCKFIPVLNICNNFAPTAVVRGRLTVIMTDECGRIWKEPFMA
jgi:hypothetical protein